MASSDTMEVRAVGSDALLLTRLPTETRRMLVRPPNGATMRVNSKLSCADRMAALAVLAAAAAARWGGARRVAWPLRLLGQPPQQHAGSARADPEDHLLQSAVG